MSRRNVLIILAVVIMAAVAALVWVYGPQEQVSTPKDGEEVAVVEKPYTNEKGEKWGPLPEGEYAFHTTYSDKDAEWPKILEGKITPLNVAVGDTQKMRVVVQDPTGIASVIAEIETDNGTVNVPLKKTGVITYKDMMPDRVIVQDGILWPLSAAEIESRHKNQIAAEESLLIKSARAAGGDKEIWEGSWVVKDTHTKTYHTTFRAKSVSGGERTLVMGWSDPCFSGPPFGGDKTLSTPCSFGAVSEGTLGAVDGWDGGNIIVSADITSLETLGHFIWNPGKSITISGTSSISLTDGHELRQAYLYFTDGDGDAYAPSAIKSFDSSPGPLAGKVRMQYARNTNDCYDSNANVYPGQTAYFTTGRGDGSFDYDCDGVISQQFPYTGSCHTCTTEICPSTISYGGPGYQGSVPTCGVAGTFINNSGSCDPIACTEDPCTTVSQTQACR